MDILINRCIIAMVNSPWLQWTDRAWFLESQISYGALSELFIFGFIFICHIVIQQMTIIFNIKNYKIGWFNSTTHLYNQSIKYLLLTSSYIFFPNLERFAKKISSRWRISIFLNLYSWWVFPYSNFLLLYWPDHRLWPWILITWGQMSWARKDEREKGIFSRLLISILTMGTLIMRIWFFVYAR